MFEHVYFLHLPFRASSVVVMDAKTLKLERFSYDGAGGDVYFWAGVGPQPSSKGHKVPDEMGYLSPLRYVPTYVHDF